MSVDKVAHAFVAGEKASCHNASTFGGAYYLHGNIIAEHKGSEWHLHWCGWYSVTTANHMNKILKALGAALRVSYAQAHDAGTTTVIVVV
jgi:hypothetical protein